MRRSLNLTTIIVLYGQTPNLDTPPAPTGRATPRCPSPLGYACTRLGAYTNGLQLSILVYFNSTVTGISKGCQATPRRSHETLTKLQHVSTSARRSVMIILRNGRGRRPRRMGARRGDGGGRRGRG